MSTDRTSLVGRARRGRRGTSRATSPEPHPAADWEVALPSGAHGIKGVSMAGFRARAQGVVETHLVPYPALTLVVNIGDELLVDGSAGRLEQGSVALGIAPPSLRGAGHAITCLQIRMSPVVAHAVLPGAADLSGSVVTLEDSWGRDATRFEEDLRTAASWEHRFAIVTATLGGRLEGGRAVDPEIEFAWRSLIRTRGLVRIEKLAYELGWSRKRLWSRFRSQVGLTPKRAAQLVRFDNAAHRLAAGHEPALVAADCGYVDQSHLHREVRAFADLTPRAIAESPWLAVDDVAWAPLAARRR